MGISSKPQPAVGRTATPLPVGFRLAEGDLEILRLVFAFRFACIEHLCALTGRSYVAIHRRLSKLTRHRYLYRIVRPFQKHIYAIGKAGIPLLVERGVASKEALDQRLRHHELKDLFIKHQMMLVDLHAILTLATRDSHVKLVGWHEGPNLRDSVTFSEDNRRHKLPVRPDAFFTLQDDRRPEGQNRAHFFLEADRSTTSHTRFQKKLKAYWHYGQQGLHNRNFGIKRFRVVVVTLTPERARNLCQTAAEVLPQGQARQLFLFTAMKTFSLDEPDGILDEVFMRPGEHLTNGRCALVPNEAKEPMKR